MTDSTPEGMKNKIAMRTTVMSVLQSMQTILGGVRSDGESIEWASVASKLQGLTSEDLEMVSDSTKAALKSFDNATLNEKTLSDVADAVSKMSLDDQQFAVVLKVYLAVAQMVLDDSAVDDPLSRIDGLLGFSTIALFKKVLLKRDAQTVDGEVVSNDAHPLLVHLLATEMDPEDPVEDSVTKTE
ncbi:hypothetical protein PP301_gp106 [Gordonia phage GMA2]|uniref:Uncharacterized protein n=1 Tax=Gordonia phage GMA2 TaxID=1647283 RepID=A0A0K0N7H4_9CAUD|nr:hypothetical protein PP301_gp106 [Gordonia phage GMA2]AKJ72616.1 hypothetical protein GMA2_78 [Gordonia phage GMA2]